jgi:hypothetical protein
VSGASNIARDGASDEMMEPSRHEFLLMSVLDGEATAGERAELLVWADAEPRLAAWEHLRGEMRAALLHEGPADVAADVLAALDEDAWSPFGAELRAATAPPSDVSVDLASAIFAALPGDVVPLSGAPDGWADTAASLRAALAPTHGAPALADEVLAALNNLDAPAGWSTTADALRVALTDAAAVASLDVWHEVVTGLEAHPNVAAPEHWSETAAALQGALAPTGGIDVAPSVMDTVSARGTLRVVNGGGTPGAQEPAPQNNVVRRRLTVLGVGLALAAAAFLAIRMGALTDAPAPEVALIVAPDAAPGAVAVARPLAARNDATVEDLTTAGTVTAQVMQFEEGGPTIIFVNEVES